MGPAGVKRRARDAETVETTLVDERRQQSKAQV
jgi:hypothetical protein